MKSLIKSMRVAAEIFTPPLLFSIVLALQMARPADHGKKSDPIHAGISAIGTDLLTAQPIEAANPLQKPAHN